MNILIVEDDRDMSELLKRLAAGKGIQDIDTAATGEEALGHALNCRYDLMTVDIKLPGVSGLDILSLLRSTNPHAVIVVLSGFIPDEIDPQTVAAADVILHKPIPMELFEHLVEGAARISAARRDLEALSQYRSPDIEKSQQAYRS